MPRYLIIDTSILCVYLRVPLMTTCGRADDVWTFDRVSAVIEQAKERNTSLVLPLATLIETGNHISQIKGHDILPYAEAFAGLIQDSVNSVNPWDAFAVQSELWSTEELQRYAEEWPQMATQKISLGDASIVRVAEYLNQIGNVEIFTGDGGLRVLAPPPQSPRQRRRDKRRRDRRE